MRKDMSSDGLDGAPGDEGHCCTGISYGCRRISRAFGVGEHNDSHCTWFVIRTAIYQRQARQHNARGVFVVLYVVLLRELAKL